MRAFAALYAQLDATASSQAKQAAMTAYFLSVPAEDAAWAVYFLAGGKPRQLVPTRVLRAFALESTGLPDWLFDECYQAVGDLAETIALLVGPATPDAPAAPLVPASPASAGLARWVDERLLPLRGQAPATVVDRLRADWEGLDSMTRFVCGKLITGAFRVGVSRLLVTRSLGAVAQVDPKRIAERLVGYTDLSNRPDAAQFLRLIASDDPGDPRQVETVGTQPYPFFLAQALPGAVQDLAARLGPTGDWLVEWKWDGIRAQVLRRGGQVAVWSRGEDLITERFPELAALAARLPDGTVLDGEIVVYRDGAVHPFASLQRRLGRKRLSARLLEELPVGLIAYDLIEADGVDLRNREQVERRSALEALVARCHAGDPSLEPVLQLSPLVEAADWPALDRQRLASRRRGVEGLMLKSHRSRYGVGRTREAGTWWKWKVDPFSIDAVLIYAQRGHGRRAGLYSDYTFAVWDRDVAEPCGASAGASAGADDGPSPRQLVPFAKAYSGLSDAEMREVDAIIRRTTVEKFGPVRRVVPSLVFELGFEGVARSARHRSGIAVRFPRMLRWRRDKPVPEADTLATLAGLLPK